MEEGLSSGFVVVVRSSNAFRNQHLLNVVCKVEDQRQRLLIGMGVVVVVAAN
jgi:hypothetical protein